MTEQLLLPGILDVTRADGIVSHTLVDAPKKGKLSLTSTKVLAYMFAQLNRDGKILEYRLTRTHLVSTLGIPKGSIHKVTKTLINELGQHQLYLETEASEKWTNLTSEIERFKSDGSLLFSFNSKLEKHLTEISKKFSKYGLHCVLSLRSSYGFYMYLLAKKYLHDKQDIFTVDLEIEEFKSRLGCAGKYKQFQHLKTEILNPLRDEFSENNDIDIVFEYQPLKTGRKTTHLSFCFTRKVKIKPRLKKTTREEPANIADVISASDARSLIPDSLK